MVYITLKKIEFTFSSVVGFYIFYWVLISKIFLICESNRLFRCGEFKACNFFMKDPREDVNLTRKSFIEYWLDAFGTLSNINFIYIKNVDIMIELVIKTNSSCFFFFKWIKNSKPNINYLWSLTAEKSFKK